LNAATARKWVETYEEEEDPDETLAAQFDEEEVEAEDELESRPAAYPIYALAAPSEYGREWSGNLNAEAVYAYAYPQPRARRRPVTFNLSDLLTGITRNRLVIVAVGVIGSWLVLSNGLNWLSSFQNADSKIYAFTGTGGVVISAEGNLSSAVTPGAVPAGATSVEGKPTITVAKIEAVLKQYNSPAAGAGQYMFDAGQKYGIDPAFALAFFIHESSAGTKGLATVTKSIGNIRQTADSGFEGYQGFRKYPSWEAGIEDWYKLIRNLYINSWGLRTVEAIVPRYAPAADRNNPPAYINHVCTLVAGWRNGS
jgi:hypothetical protein